MKHQKLQELPSLVLYDKSILSFFLRSAKYTAHAPRHCEVLNKASALLTLSLYVEFPVAEEQCINIIYWPSSSAVYVYLYVVLFTHPDLYTCSTSLLKGKTVSAPALVLYPVILPSSSYINCGWEFKLLVISLIRIEHR